MTMTPAAKGIAAARQERRDATQIAALKAFASKKAEIDEMLARINGFSADHFNATPESITFADVGTLAYYADRLRNICDSAFNEGEYWP